LSRLWSRHHHRRMGNWTAEFSYWNCRDCAVFYNSFSTTLPFSVSVIVGIGLVLYRERAWGNHNGSLVNMLH